MAALEFSRIFGFRDEQEFLYLGLSVPVRKALYGLRVRLRSIKFWHGDCMRLHQKAHFGSNDFPGREGKAYSGISLKVFRLRNEVSKITERRTS